MTNSQHPCPVQGVNTVQSNCQHDHGRQRSRIAIIGLVAAHLAAALTLGTCARLFDLDEDDVLGTLFIGLTFAQAGLLGFWSAIGSARWQVRLVGLLSGTPCLAIVASVSTSENGLEPYVFFASLTFGVAAGFSVPRYFGYRLAGPALGPSTTLHFQFGIRHILVLTLLVALVLVFLLNAELGLSGFGLVLLMGMIALPFIAVGLVVPWAMLGLSRLPIRVGVLLVVSTATAWLASVTWNAPQLAWVLLAQAALLAGTLLVVRLCGYRVVKLAKKSPGGTTLS